MPRKIIVRVLAEFDEAGKISPRSVTWENGCSFAIDRILDRRPAPSLKAGGSGLRYICRICGREVCLFQDHGQWYLEEND